MMEDNWQEWALFDFDGGCIPSAATTTCLHLRQALTSSMANGAAMKPPAVLIFCEVWRL